MPRVLVADEKKNVSPLCQPTSLERLGKVCEGHVKGRRWVCLFPSKDGRCCPRMTGGGQYRKIHVHVKEYRGSGGCSEPCLLREESMYKVYEKGCSAVNFDRNEIRGFRATAMGTVGSSREEKKGKGPPPELRCQ